MDTVSEAVGVCDEIRHNLDRLTELLGRVRPYDATQSEFEDLTDASDKLFGAVESLENHWLTGYEVDAALCGCQPKSDA